MGYLPIYPDLGYIAKYPDLGYIAKYPIFGVYPKYGVSEQVPVPGTVQGLYRVYTGPVYHYIHPYGLLTPISRDWVPHIARAHAPARYRVRAHNARGRARACARARSQTHCSLLGLTTPLISQWWAHWLIKDPCISSGGVALIPVSPVVGIPADRGSHPKGHP